MKIHNIAVAGIFVTIFGLINTAHADTVIASQAYVDAKDDLKLNVSSVNTGSLVSNSTTTVPSEQTVYNAIQNAAPSASNYISDGTTALSLTAATDKAPSVSAVQGSVLYSGNTASTNTKTANVNVTNIAANSAVFTTNTTVKADGDSYVPTVAAVEARVKAVESAATNDKEGSNVIKSSATTKVATVGGIQQSILYSGNDASTNNHTDNVDTTSITGNAAVLSTNATVKGHGDDYVPTVAAVEARVKAVEDRTLAGNTTNRDALTARNASNVITSTGSDTNIPSTALLVDVLQTLDGANANGATGVSAGAAADTTKAGQAVVAVSQTDGKVTATLGTVKYKTGMNNALMNTNTGAALGSSDCKKDNPCVLTYYTDGANTFMRWTPMDTNSTNANVTLASGE